MCVCLCGFSFLLKLLRTMKSEEREGKERERQLIFEAPESSRARGSEGEDVCSRF